MGFPIPLSMNFIQIGKKPPTKVHYYYNSREWGSQFPKPNDGYNRELGIGNLYPYFTNEVVLFYLFFE